jgi:aldehyde dehydrogenase (NAD+)
MKEEIFEALGLRSEMMGASAGGFLSTEGDSWESRSPVDGSLLGCVKLATTSDYHKVMGKTLDVFDAWRMAPAPQRGDIVRQMANALRENQQALGRLVSLEMGKIEAEGIGEVQEMIDIADFAVGLSRQLCGQTFKSERPLHAMQEQWHPIGCVGIISAFNFPVAVWSWNAFLSAVCGNVMIWKPSLKTPYTALAVQTLMDQVLEKNGFSGVMSLVIGHDAEVGETLIRDRRIPLVSATGSCRMGRHVGGVVAERMGRSLLELGGNNALIVMEDADLDLALPAVVFGAVGTAGQRCTTTRRLLLQKNIADAFIERLLAAYTQVRVGNPLDEATLMGPLIDKDAVEHMQAALEKIRSEGGEVLYGGEVLEGTDHTGGCYVRPCVVRVESTMPMVKEETFAPILYVITFDTLNEAIAIQNDVPQGLSSAIFTDSIRHGYRFISASGSDCGIANINIGTSGAEIGGAFGGEKDTGGGREAGSDSWKAYMRRQTQTINWSTELPLAQGIKFG